MNTYVKKAHDTPVKIVYAITNQLMKYLLATLLLSFCFGLNGQKPFEIRMDEAVPSRNELPFNLTGVNDLTETMDVIGTVHTGLLNKPRQARLQYGTEGGLLYIAKPTAGNYGPEVPTATLNLLQLKVSETILAMKEIGRIEMVATLTLETPEGSMQYGPAQFESTKSGMTDVTAQHKSRITEALDQVLRSLADAYLAGNEIAGAIPDYTPLKDDIANGVYRTGLDFMMARTTPDLVLLPNKQRVAGSIGEVEFLQVNFKRGENVRRKDVDKIYGYHLNGESYLFVKNRFYSVKRLADGRIMAYLPKDLYRILDEGATIGYAVGGILGGILGAALDDSNTLVRYELDLATGRFLPETDTGR